MTTFASPSAKITAAHVIADAQSRRDFAKKTAKLALTTEAYVRSHLKAPAGRGGWMFQAASATTAYDRELTGQMLTFRGTYTEAKAALKASGATGLFAVLP